MVSPSPYASVSPSISILGPAGAIAVTSPSLTVAQTSPLVPIYAHAPSSPKIIEITGTAVKGLLVAARDGSDLFLPLKAALVGIVALWDIWDVRQSLPN